jgi:hypothetical protein
MMPRPPRRSTLSLQVDVAMMAAEMARSSFGSALLGSVVLSRQKEFGDGLGLDAELHAVDDCRIGDVNVANPLNDGLSNVVEPVEVCCAALNSRNPQDEDSQYHAEGE